MESNAGEGYSLAGSFYKLLQHLRSPNGKKDMAETSPPATRNNTDTAYQITPKAKQNGPIDSTLSTTLSTSSPPTRRAAATASAALSPHSKSTPSSTGVRAKMTKQNLTKNLRNQTEGKNPAAVNSKPALCNGKSQNAKFVKRG